MLIQILLSMNKISYKATDSVVYNIKYIMMESITNQKFISKILFDLVLVM